MDGVFVVLDSGERLWLGGLEPDDIPAPSLRIEVNPAARIVIDETEEEREAAQEAEQEAEAIAHERARVGRR